MVRLVLVAHSRALAEQVEEFVRQMAGPDVPIAIAAGTGTDGADFGTDATAILEVLTTDPPDDGQIILVDVGSAVMSAEMALEMLPDDLRPSVRLSSAPFVEGTLSAAVQAGTGADLETVVQEAQTALRQKQDALPDEAPASSAPSPVPPSPDAEAEVTLPNPHGLHARPAAQFVRRAASFDARITVENATNERGPVSATSISALPTLAAGQGHRLRLHATGPDAEAAVQALVDLIADGFGETEESADAAPPAPASAPTIPDRLGAPRTAVAVSPGIAIAPAFVHRPSLPPLPTDPPDDPKAAWDALRRTLDAVADTMDRERDTHASAGRDDAAGILDAQRLLLLDDTLRERVREAVLDAQTSPARAWMNAVENVAGDYSTVDDPYLQQRADDVRDVGQRVVRALLDLPPPTIDGPDAPFILVADRLAPSDVPALDEARVRGVVCAGGSPTAHSAILLRSQGLPAVFGAGSGILGVRDGTPLALNGAQGTYWVDPDEATAEALRRQQQAERDAREAALQAAQDPAETTNGTRITVEANVNRPDDAEAAVARGADGVGLLRTEFLFTDREAPPSEAEQVEALRTVAETLDGKPLTVRALDIGGDKPLRYVPLPEEPNPFLGIRGIRVLLRHTDLFRTQLRAVLRVAADHPVRLMLPMVTVPSEVQAARALLTETWDGLRDEDVPVPEALPLGVMIETPASALSVPRLREAVDFLSIGTNDLTQYTLAADREASELGDLSDALHPPVLALLQRVVDDAGDVPVSICGEIAADPVAVPLLVGLGIRRLSVVPPAIPRVKAAVRTTSVDDAQALAERALEAEDAAAVRAMLAA